MKYKSKSTVEKLLNEKGESFIELMVAMFILTVTITVIVSAFMSGRAGMESAWMRTEMDHCAASLMEQLKAAPYDQVIAELDGNEEKVGITLDESTLGLTIPNECQSFEFQYSLLTYESYLKDELLQVVVKVREDETKPWFEKASLLRKGESS